MGNIHTYNKRILPVRSTVLSRKKRVVEKGDFLNVIMKEASTRKQAVYRTLSKELLNHRACVSRKAGKQSGTQDKKSLG